MALLKFDAFAFRQANPDGLMEIDFEALNRSLLAQCPSLLYDWFPNGKKAGSRFVIGDIRGERGDSLSISLDTGQWFDFATEERGSDLISLYADRNGIDQYDAAVRLSGNNLPKKPRLPSFSHVQIPKVEPILTRQWVVPPAWAENHECVHVWNGKPTMLWRYSDEEGRTIGYVARYQGKDGKKTFCPWTWGGSSWETKKWQGLQPIYGMEFLAADKDRSILLVEGEKACDAARRFVGDQFFVCTWPGGAANVSTVDWSILWGRNVLLWPDADEAGLSAMKKIKDIFGEHVKSVAAIDVSSFPEKWDAADALADGWTEEKFSAFIASQFSQPVTVSTAYESGDEFVDADDEISVPAELLTIPGALGELVRHTCDCAWKPQPVLAVGAALVAGSTLMGRIYRNSDGDRAGLILLGMGPTGSGKEMARAVNKHLLVAAGLKDLLGGEEIKSDSALMNRMVNTPRCLFQLDEFGLMLQKFTNQKAGGHEKAIITTMMRLNTSTRGVMHGAEYAAQDRQDIAYPSANFWLTTTPGTLWPGITGNDILSGAVNRMIFMTSDRPNIKARKPTVLEEDVPPQVVRWAKALANGQISTLPEANAVEFNAETASMSPRTIPITDEAAAVFMEMMDWCETNSFRNRISGMDALYQRGFEQSKRIALVVAGSIHAGVREVVVCKQSAEWSVAFVKFWLEWMITEIQKHIADSEFGRICNKVMQTILKAKARGVTERELGRSCSIYNGLKPQERDQVLAVLARDEKIIQKERVGGRGKTIPVLVAKEFSEESIAVDQ